MSVYGGDSVKVRFFIIAALLRSGHAGRKLRVPFCVEADGGDDVARTARWERWLTDEALTKIQGWARDGLIEKQIAHNMSISVTTLTDWKKRFPQILEALQKGKEVVDREVENALYKRALGYWVTETKTITMPDGDVRTEEIHKHIAPDTTAQIFWLKNRKPDQWREKNDLTLTPSNGVLESLMELHNGKRNVEP